MTFFRIDFKRTHGRKRSKMKSFLFDNFEHDQRRIVLKPLT